ncbi:Potassium efflux system KefA precursor [Raoultella ornithinolytica]|nr:Potassium efflux system KefA precursor [Raoultella ornithinolytica]
MFGLCWKVLEKDGVAVSHFNMPPQLTSHWRRQIVRVSLALLPLNFWSVVSETVAAEFDGMMCWGSSLSSSICC